MVDLINNALGPSTVSLQTLNKWVANNSTTLGGFSAIVATSTIKAGSLAGVLENQLNVQFHDALLKTSGASAARLVQYCQRHRHNQTQAAQGKAGRAQLIRGPGEQRAVRGSRPGRT